MVRRCIEKKNEVVGQDEYKKGKLRELAMVDSPRWAVDYYRQGVEYFL